MDNLVDHLVAARLKSEWGVLLRELERLQEVETERDGRQIILRTPVTGDIGRAFKTVGVALPPNVREVRPTEPAGVSEQSSKRSAVVRARERKRQRSIGFIFRSVTVGLDREKQVAGIALFTLVPFYNFHALKFNGCSTVQSLVQYGILSRNPSPAC